MLTFRFAHPFEKIIGNLLIFNRIALAISNIFYVPIVLPPVYRTDHY